MMRSFIFPGRQIRRHAVLGVVLIAALAFGQAGAATLPLPNAYDDYQIAGKMIREKGKLGAAFSSLFTAYHLKQAPLSLAEKKRILRLNLPALRRLQQGLAHPYRIPVRPSAHDLFFRVLQGTGISLGCS